MCNELLGMRSVLSPKLMFAKRDKHYPSRSGQTSLATAVTNLNKNVTKIDFGPRMSYISRSEHLSRTGPSHISVESCSEHKVNGQVSLSLFLLPSLLANYTPWLKRETSALLPGSAI